MVSFVALPSCDFVPFVVKAPELGPDPSPLAAAFRLFSSRVKSYIIPQEFAFMKHIHKVAILGAGTMGARIAAHFANAGVTSLLLDIIPTEHPENSTARHKIHASGL